MKFEVVFTVCCERLQEDLISINELSLAFCGVELFSVARGSLRKPALECSDEARNVLVSHNVSNLFDTHISAGKKMSCFLKPLLVEPLTDANTSLVLEEALEMRRAEVELDSQVANRECPAGLDHSHDFSDATFCNRLERQRNGSNMRPGTVNGVAYSVLSRRGGTRIQNAHPNLTLCNLRPATLPRAFRLAEESGVLWALDPVGSK